MPDTKSTTYLAKPAFFDREQLAARWGCSLSTIKRREASGELAPVRFGPRLVRYPMAAIEAYEDRQSAGSKLSGIAPETKAATAGQVSGIPVSGTTTNQTNYAASTASRKNR